MVLSFESRTVILTKKDRLSFISHGSWDPEEAHIFSDTWVWTSYYYILDIQYEENRCDGAIRQLVFIQKLYNAIFY